MQHWIVKLAFSGNYDAPVGEALEEGDIVLDAGCGKYIYIYIYTNEFSVFINIISQHYLL